MSEYRILVTGSRDWTDDKTIAVSMMKAESEAFMLGYKVNEIVLVSGACPTGADKIAEELAEKFSWQIERHPAQWDKYGKRAGFIRNQNMVYSGINITLAFIKNQSKGATMTAKLSEQAGVRTVRHTE